MSYFHVKSCSAFRFPWSAGHHVLTFNVLLVVVMVLFIRDGCCGVEDLLEALDPQGFVQVPFILFFRVQTPV